TAITLEAHLVEAEANFYGSPGKRDFIHRIRSIVSFRTREELVSQLHKDADEARRALTLLGEASNIQDSPAHPIH
ncbi:MAG: riboflavin kinase, partial [Gemmatimonadaceae bacterium]